MDRLRLANEVHTASAGLDPRTQGFASAEEASDGQEAEDVDHGGLDVLENMFTGQTASIRPATFGSLEKSLIAEKPKPDRHRPA